ncbi:MAG: hypothetical protein J6575_04540 [Bifidobacterium sp.]|nr:hypothetical protein [Bifidobacterium sp.]
MNLMIDGDSVAGNATLDCDFSEGNAKAEGDFVAGNVYMGLIGVSVLQSAISRDRGTLEFYDFEQKRFLRLFIFVALKPFAGARAASMLLFPCFASNRGCVALKGRGCWSFPNFRANRLAVSLR